MQYGVRYSDHVVHDPSWVCEADVIASYHGTDYVTPDRGVTGELVQRQPGRHAWWKAHA